MRFRPTRPSLGADALGIGFAVMLGGLASIVAFAASRSQETTTIHSQFRADGEERAWLVRESLLETEQILESLSALWASSDLVRFDEFESFSEHILSRHSPVDLLAWAPRVADGLGGFSIPLRFVTPNRNPAELLDLDLLAQPPIREALFATLKDGKPRTVTAGLGAIGRGNPKAFLTALPVYERGLTAAGSVGSPVGWAIGVFRMDHLLDAALHGVELAGVQLAITSAGTRSDSEVFAVLPSDHDPNAEADESFPRDIEVGGTQWTVTCSTEAGYVAARRGWLPWMLLATGVLLGVLMVLALYTHFLRTTKLDRANELLRRQIEVRRAAEAALRESERRLTTLLGNLPGAAYRAIPKDGWHLEFISDGCQQLTGYTADVLQGGLVRYESLIRSDDRDRIGAEIDAALLEGRPYGVEYRILDAHGAEKWVWEQGSAVKDEQGEILAVEGFLSDVTPAKRAAEEQARIHESLLQTQKLESLGILAGGIAHDFNNLLTGILGNAEVALLHVDQDPKISRPLGQVVNAARRAAGLTRQLLAYSGKASMEREPIGLTELIRDIHPLLVTAIPKKVNLQLKLGDDLPAIEADSSQIQQLVMNLVINGAEACGDGAGRVTVRTERPDPQLLRQHSLQQDPATRWVALTVTDDGCGMDEETRSRIFEPFYTTKFTGRGLGLSGVLGIVNSHGGHLDVASTPGSGTVFTALLPTCEKTVPIPKPPTAPVAAGEGAILIVDDEQIVLDVARRILEAYGYRVLSASSAEHGLEMFRRRSDGIDVVILDMTMPEMNGPELLRAMRRQDPDLRAILSSGYHEADVDTELRRLAPVTFVQKPYRPSELVRHVQEAIGARQHT